ncbi:MAG: TolC family protein [Phocaeicola sp.]
MKKIVLLFALYCTAQAAGGQNRSTTLEPTGSLEANRPSVKVAMNTLLEHYRMMALAYNHDLKAAEKNIAASIELIKSAKDDAKPKLDGNANFQYTGNPMELSLNLPTFEGPLSFRGQEVAYGASLSLMQPLYTGGRILESIRRTEQQHNVALNQKDLIATSVCFQTDVQYWNTVASRELATLYADFYQSMSELKSIVAERVEVGITDPQDLLMVEVKQNDSHYQLLRAESNAQTHGMALNSLVGIELQKAVEVDKVVSPVVHTQFLYSNLPATRAEIRLAYDQINLEQSALRLNDSKYKPQLYIGAEGSYASPGYNFKRDLDPNYALYAKLSVPIFHWGKRNSDKRAFKNKVEVAHHNLNKVKDAVELEVQKAELNLTQASQRVELTNSSLEKAEENEEKAIERYNEGKASIVEVIDAQVYKQTAQINYVQAKLTVQLYFAELQKAMNGYQL